jgi:Mg2+ and Co2+ transporters
MLTAYVPDNGCLRAVNDPAAHRDEIVWADLLAPTDEERHTVEAWLGIEFPSREEMEEIELSSRLYAENGVHYMTATLPAKSDDDSPEMGPVTFILAGNRLLTLRFHTPYAFETFPEIACKTPIGSDTGQSVLIGLLEVIVDRIADILERASRDILDLSIKIFHTRDRKASTRDTKFHAILHQLGRKEHLLSNVQESLLTLRRLSAYLSTLQLSAREVDLTARGRVLSRDIMSLSDHAISKSQKINFLLDATLGMINIEQNAIIKIFSVAAVVFLPPTLVASMYGMNFELMPELHWKFGYLWAIGLMVVSALLPYLYFKRRGWL